MNSIAHPILFRANILFQRQGDSWAEAARTLLLASSSRHPLSGDPESAASHVGGPDSVCPADWDLMYEAVRARIGIIAGTLTDQPDGSAPGARTYAAQAAMQECVDALGKLHAMLVEQRQRQRQAPKALAVGG